MPYTKVKSVEHLKELCGKGRDFFIWLGCCHSSKDIVYDPKTDAFDVVNLIDGSEQMIKAKELLKTDDSNIGDAISKGAFFFEG